MFNYEELLKLTTEAANLAVEEKEIDEMTAEIESEKAIDDALFEVETESMLEACEMSLNIEAYAATTMMVEGEAAKDILARRAYAASAAIKTLIRTVIAWFKRILGLNANVKKVCKSLSKKAKAMKKVLNKYSAKVAAKNEKNDNEITKEVIDYADKDRGIAAVYAKITEVNTVVKQQAGIIASTDKLATNAEAASSSKSSTSNTDTGTSAESDREVMNSKSGVFESTTVREGDVSIEATIQYTSDSLSNIKETYKEELPKEDKNLIEIKNMLIAALTALQGYKETEDTNKAIEKANKALNKAYTNAGKLDSEKNAKIDTAIRATLSKATTQLTNASSILQLAIKEYVKLADNCFTDCKWLMAKVA